MSCRHHLIEADLHIAYNTYVGRKSALKRNTGAAGQKYLGWGKWNTFYVNVGVSRIGSPYLMFSIKKPYKSLIDGHVYPHQLMVFSNPADKSFMCSNCRQFKTFHERLTEALQGIVEQIEEGDNK